MTKSKKDIPKRIAVVHEWFSPEFKGGAEQVVQAIDQLLLAKGIVAEFGALIDTESSRPGSWLAGRLIKTSIVQRLPWGGRNVQKFLPLLPYAIEQLDLSQYPLVISSSHLVAKGVITSPDQLHVSYIHSPPRYAWDQMHIYLERSSISRIGFGALIRWQLHQLRQWDQLTGMRADHLFANSRFTARRIAKYWGRSSRVIHPPVDVDRFRSDQDRQDFYLCLCRLVPNKRVDLVVNAFNELQKPLIVIGDGPEKEFLKRIAGPSVQILGHQSPQKVIAFMESCRAYVYAGVEDFGIAPVEAMAAGAPVIAFGKGGVLDTVRCFAKDVPSPTGILFPDQTTNCIIEAVQWFEEKSVWRKLSPDSIREWAVCFSHENFAYRFENALLELWARHMKSRELAASDPMHILDFPK